MTPIKLSAGDFTYTNGIKIKRTKLNKPGILFAYASWCGACASAHPKVEALSNSARNHTVYEIDADQEQTFGTRANITHFPTFFYVSPDGKVEPLEETNIQNVVDSVCRKYSQCITQTGGSRDSEKKALFQDAYRRISELRGALLAADRGQLDPVLEKIKIQSTNTLAETSRIRDYSVRSSVINILFNLATSLARLHSQQGGDVEAGGLTSQRARLETDRDVATFNKALEHLEKGNYGGAVTTLNGLSDPVLAAEIIAKIALRG
jgi:thiol-disulfide isomerase/thioredoxin